MQPSAKSTVGARRAVAKPPGVEVTADDVQRRHREASPGSPDLDKQQLDVFVTGCNRKQLEQATQRLADAMMVEDKVFKHIQAARRAANSLARALPDIIKSGTASAADRNAVTTLVRELPKIATMLSRHDELPGFPAHDELPRLTRLVGDIVRLKEYLDSTHKTGPAVLPTAIYFLPVELEWLKELLVTTREGGQPQSYIHFARQIAATYADCLYQLSDEAAIERARRTNPVVNFTFRAEWAQPTSPVVKFTFHAVVAAFGEVFGSTAEEETAALEAIAKAVRRELTYDRELLKWGWGEAADLYRQP
jgi:hypothetical protein